MTIPPQELTGKQGKSQVQSKKRETGLHITVAELWNSLKKEDKMDARLLCAEQGTEMVQKINH